MATTDITFQVNTAHLQRFIDGMAAHYGYQDFDITGEPNTETKAAFAKRSIRREWIHRVNQQERKTAIEAIETDVIEVT